MSRPDETSGNELKRFGEVSPGHLCDGYGDGQKYANDGVLLLLCGDYFCSRGNVVHYYAPATG